ncbi:hypothetical protein [Flagellimonas beolgyonensis]|uniref:hypothetical protein n=1 Tax=Flagellimonas beolgyonensis TaxID=864064 RepID=UPI000F8EDE90|nr:hypothetical protein [Allomuricauda beolgyonensis]
MKKTIITLCLALLVLGCKNKEKENVEEHTGIETVEVPVYNLEVGCYAYEGNGDRVLLEITEINNSVLGNLSYNLAEKDANSGTFAGMLQDSILIGKYTFMSEGTDGNTREVAFLWKNGQLLEGFGELDATGTSFKDKNTLKFTSNMPLSKTECDL